VLLVPVLFTGCEQAEERREEPARRVVVPPPRAEGIEIATLQITPPKGNDGRKIFAGLKRDGRIVGRGDGTVSATGTTAVVMRTLDKTVELKNGAYDLWLVIDRDGWQACHPSFGDWYLRDTWQWPKVGRTLLYDDPTAWKLKRLEHPDNLITIHYHRYDEDYDDAGIWTWDENKQKSPEQNELFEVGRDDFGLVFQMDRGEYGLKGDSDKIGMLPRLHASWDQKDGEDRFWRPDMGKEIYLVGGKNKVFTKKPDTSPQVTAAYIDTADRLVVEVSRPLNADEVATDKIKVIDRTDAVQPVTAAKLMLTGRQCQSNSIEVSLTQPLDVSGNVYQVSVAGFGGTAQATPRGVLDDPALFCDRQAALGATYHREATSTRLCGPLPPAEFRLPPPARRARCLSQ
jgi:hypothetical protein